MGACSSEESHNRRLIGNPLLEGSATKSFSQNSNLDFLVRTWNGQSLPNLRFTEGMTEQSLSFKDQGRIIYSTKKKSVVFQNSSENTDDNLPDSHKFAEHPTSVLELQVQKSKSGFMVDFVNEPGYELLTGEKQISMGEKFFMGGLEYQVVGLFTNEKEAVYKSAENIKTQDSSNSENSSDPSSTKSVPFKSNSNKSVSLNQKATCRICLGNDVTQDNPFVSPCDCTGSVKHCHLNCWKTWIMSIQTGNKQYYRGSILKEKCQICKKDLLTDQDYREKVIGLLLPNANVPKPFIVLEAIQPKGNCLYLKRKTEKISYVFVSFAEKSKVTLGSSTEVDVPLTSDLKKGRSNACIEYKDGKVILNDSITKYGTFVKRQGPVVIQDNAPRHFLYKNNLITLKAQ